MERTYMTCPNCGGEYSINPADYFMRPADWVFTCAECGRPMVYVTRIVHFKWHKEPVTLETMHEFYDK